MKQNEEKFEYSVDRLTDEKVGKMNVNDFIAILTTEANNNVSGMFVHPELKEKAENVIKIFVYIRDKVLIYDKDEPKMVIDVLNAIANGKVDPKIIEVWIDEGMISGGIANLIKTGYPEFKEEIEIMMKK
jgi:hypothetical protein